MAVPTDPLFGLQWHFGLLGDIGTIWDDFDGTGVSVGVFDDGVQPNNPDLLVSYDPGLHFTHAAITYDAYPISNADASGTAAAGLIAAAANNGQGGAGVAWGATVTGINYTEDLQYAATPVLQAAFDWAGVFDVALAPPGTVPLYGTDRSLGVPGSLAAMMDAGFATAAAGGRGGLGTVILQGAGDHGRSLFGDGASGAKASFAIGAVGSDGAATTGANHGAGILVAAPAASVTTDRTGGAGLNGAGIGDGDLLADTNFTSIYGGTHAAAATASGVAALILQAAPGLGWRDIGAVLAETARLTGSTVGGAATGNEAGPWVVASEGTWNGGATIRHPDYGHGLIDAYAAVRLAEAWVTMTGAAGVTANRQVQAVPIGAPVALNDAGTSGGITDIPFVAAVDRQVERVVVDLSMTHTHAPDLEISLIAPGGDVFELMNRDGDAGLMDAGFNWRFTLDSVRGLTAAGTWVLRITDHAVADTGSVTAATVSVWGERPAANDIHTISADYLTLVALDGARATLDDADGGVDWLNLTALPGDVVLSLNPGAAFTVGGAAWGTVASGAIENAYAGDGNDRLTGNGAANELHGGRGDDTLVGGGGADRMFGGAGADYLLDFSADADLLDGGDGDDQLQGSGGGDTYVGGAGTDEVRYNNSPAGVTVNLATGATAGGDAAGDTFDAIENIVGSQHADTITGDAGANRLEGFLGDDWLQGGAGADVLYGDLGFDFADYSDSTAGVDVGIYRTGTGGTSQGDQLIYIEGITGSPHNDTLVGAGLAYVVLNGGDGDDLLFDYGGPSALNGGAGNDTMIGRLGADAFDGGPGVDAVRYADAIGAVNADLTTGTGSGADATGDTYVNVENLVGSIFFDTLTGDAGNNRIDGLGGRDLITGRGGTDLLFGGADRDTFVFDTTSWGNDYIYDFVNDFEQLDVSAIGLTFADFTVVDTGFGVRLDYWDGSNFSSISLAGLDPADIGPEDFII